MFKFPAGWPEVKGQRFCRRFRKQTFKCTFQFFKNWFIPVSDMCNTKKLHVSKGAQMETEVCVKASRENSWRAVIDTRKLKVASPSEFGKVKKQHSRGRLSFFPSFFYFPFCFPLVRCHFKNKPTKKCYCAERMSAGYNGAA